MLHVLVKGKEERALCGVTHVKIQEEKRQLEPNLQKKSTCKVPTINSTCGIYFLALSPTTVWIPTMRGTIRQRHNMM